MRVRVQVVSGCVTGVARRGREIRSVAMYRCRGVAYGRSRSAMRRVGGWGVGRGLGRGAGLRTMGIEPFGDRTLGIELGARGRGSWDAARRGQP